MQPNSQVSAVEKQPIKVMIIDNDADILALLENKLSLHECAVTPVLVEREPADESITDSWEKTIYLQKLRTLIERVNPDVIVSDGSMYDGQEEGTIRDAASVIDLLTDMYPDAPKRPKMIVHSSEEDRWRIVPYVRKARDSFDRIIAMIQGGGHTQSPA